jgi:hypothetical protein
MAELVINFIYILPVLGVLLQAALAPSAKGSREHRLCIHSLAQRVFKVGSEGSGSWRPDPF